MGRALQEEVGSRGKAQFLACGSRFLLKNQARPLLMGAGAPEVRDDGGPRAGQQALQGLEMEGGSERAGLRDEGTRPSRNGLGPEVVQSRRGKNWTRRLRRPFRLKTAAGQPLLHFVSLPSSPGGLGRVGWG